MDDVLNFGASFLLGKMHIGLNLALEAEISHEDKIEIIKALEREIRADINKLFYSNSVSRENVQ